MSTKHNICLFMFLSKCQQCQLLLDLDLWVSVTGYKRDTSSGDVSHVCSYDCISWQHVMYKISYTPDGRTDGRTHEYTHYHHWVSSIQLWQANLTPQITGNNSADEGTIKNDICLLYIWDAQISRTGTSENNGFTLRLSNKPKHL